MRPVQILQKESGRTCHSERSEESLAAHGFFASLRMTRSPRLLLLIFRHYNLLRGLGQLVDELLVEPDAVLAIDTQTVVRMAIWRGRIVFCK